MNDRPLGSAVAERSPEGGRFHIYRANLARLGREQPTPGRWALRGARSRVWGHGVHRETECRNSGDPSLLSEYESESVESYGSKSSVYSDSLPDSLRRILPNWMTLGILR
jgi:hypothetical protein